MIGLASELQVSVVYNDDLNPSFARNVWNWGEFSRQKNLCRGHSMACNVG
jgi:hypothetical protein